MVRAVKGIGTSLSEYYKYRQGIGSSDDSGNGVGISLTEYYKFKLFAGGGDEPRGHVDENGMILDSWNEIAENLASRNHVYKIGNWKNTESKGE